MLTNALKVLVNNSFKKSFYAEKIKKVINIWVNYTIGPYPLHYILIWFLAFQLCQFNP